LIVSRKLNFLAVIEIRNS